MFPQIKRRVLSQGKVNIHWRPSPKTAGQLQLNLAQNIMIERN